MASKTPRREQFEPINWDQRKVISEGIREIMTAELFKMECLSGLTLADVNRIVHAASGAAYSACGRVKEWRELSDHDTVSETT